MSFSDLEYYVDGTIAFWGTVPEDQARRELVRVLVEGDGRGFRGLAALCDYLDRAGVAEEAAEKLAAKSLYQKPTAKPEVKTVRIPKPAFTKRIDSIGRAYFVPRVGGQRVSRATYESDRARIERAKRRALHIAEAEARAPKVGIFVQELKGGYRNRDIWKWWVSVDQHRHDPNVEAGDPTP